MKKAILAVSFGTSYPDTLEQTIAATEQTLAQAFPDWEVRRAFTSGMIINKLRQRDGVEIDNVARAMDRLEAEGFTVRSTLRGLGVMPAVQDMYRTHLEEDLRGDGHGT